MESTVGIDKEILTRIQNAFASDPKNLLARNICTRYDPLEVAISRAVLEKTNHFYNHTVKPEGRPVTNQKSSGRCWIFAMLNVARQAFMQKYNLEEFEFSQTHLFFWDKIERAYFFLNVFIELARKKEKPDGRLLMFLLNSPLNDGGQWDMLVNLVEKHGMVPRSVWPEPYNATSSRNMNRILNHKLREYCLRIQKMVEGEVTDEEMTKEIETMMTEVYRVVSVCLGAPPEKFTWEYYDKNKKFNRVTDLDSVKFYETHVKPCFNISDKVCLVNDERSTSLYDKLYTVQYLGNMFNGKKTLYLNQPIDTLKSLAAESIRINEPVWFGCDVGKHFQRSSAVLDLDLHNFELAFGIDMKGLGKGDRLYCSDSLMTHAMVFTGFATEEYELDSGKSNQTDQEKVEEDKKEQPVSLQPVKATKWRVENSWGEDPKAEKGYLMMTDDWFSEYVYEVVVDKKLVPDKILELLNQEVIELPAWDPMGALACANCGDHGPLKSTL